MAEKIIDTQVTQLVPPKEQREGYQIPFIKKTEGEPQGGNFDLDSLLSAEVTQAELDALDAKKADKAIEKGVFLDVDNPIFRVDGNGVPLPPVQKATIRAKKKYIEEPIHWDVKGRTIPDGTESIEVSVDELADVQKGIVLKNELTTKIRQTRCEGTADGNVIHVVINEDNAQFGYDFDASSNLVKGNKYYISYTIKNISVNGTFSSNSNGIFPSVTDTIPVGSLKTITGIFTSMREASNYDWYLIKTLNTATGAYDITKNIEVIDITALSEAYPQYSDEQLKAILDESLPYISAGQSKTLGGVCRLENLVPNPFSTEGWEAGTHVSNFIATNDTIAGIPQGKASQDSNFWISKLLKKSLSDANCFVKVTNLTSTGSKILGVGWHYPSESNYSVFHIKSREGDRNILHLGANDDQKPTISFNPSKGVLCFDLTSSLLDLWLSLHGIDTDEAKADWCNEHIPAFEGTYNLVLGIENSLPIKVTAGTHTAQTALNVVENIGTAITGDIVDSGDGYIRFKDGTQMCHNIGTLTGLVWRVWGNGYIADYSQITFPMPFVGQKTIVDLVSVTDNSYFDISKVITSTGFKGKICRMSEGSASLPMGYIAIGRWK